MKNKIEKFTIRGINYETRSDDSGKRYIRGIIPYNSKSEDMGFYEIISPSAFNKTLSDGADVKALFDHSSSRVLGSTRAGTLRLESTHDGLVCDCELPNTTYANDLYEVVSRGDVSTMSFGFSPVKYEDKGNTRTLKEVKLYEVSFGVSFPAYAETQSMVMKRSLNEVVEELKTIEIKEDEKANVLKVLEEIKAKIQPIKEEVVLDEVIPDTSVTDALILEMEIEMAMK
jgi:HK97 family phage prohead protease